MSPGKGQTAVFNFKTCIRQPETRSFLKTKITGFIIREGTHLITKSPNHFSAKGAALRFLRTLFANIQMPEKVIVGEPASS